MEKYIKRLRTLRQELVATTNAGLKFSKHNVKDSKYILDEIDSILDDMENNLTEFIDDDLKKEQFEIKSNLDFDKAVEPAIRYLLRHHNPHTKIYIDYENAELLEGVKSHNLKNEVPD